VGGYTGVRSAWRVRVVHTKCWACSWSWNSAFSFYWLCHVYVRLCTRTSLLIL